MAVFLLVLFIYDCLLLLFWWFKGGDGHYRGPVTTTIALLLSGFVVVGTIAFLPFNLASFYIIVVGLLANIGSIAMMGKRLNYDNNGENALGMGMGLLAILAAASLI